MSFFGLFSRSRRRRTRARRRLAVTVATVLGLGAMAVAATAYSRLYVFGETLSDVGALLAAAGITNTPYQSPGFDASSPPVWAEDIAQHIGLQANSWTSGGANVAAGDIDGVLPDGFSLPSLAAQLQGYLAGGAPDPNGLYVIQGGSGNPVVAAAIGQISNALGIGGALITDGSPSLGQVPTFDTAAPLIAGLGPRQAFVPLSDPNSGPDCSDCGPPQEPCADCIVVTLPCAECFTEDPDKDKEKEIACLGAQCVTPTENIQCIPDCPTDNPDNNQQTTRQVPEPATGALILAGLSLLVLVRQRRSARARRV